MAPGRETDYYNGPDMNSSSSLFSRPENCPLCRRIRLWYEIGQSRKKKRALEDQPARRTESSPQWLVTEDPAVTEREDALDYGLGGCNQFPENRLLPLW